ncbi:MAG TPA: hypothetical protein PKA64_11695 [Myxococcota bacterium]|nr:hypothetical protein [Myxococcota bacterium]
MWSLLMSAALAQGLIPQFDQTTERTYKIEVIYQDMGLKETADHRTADAELWGGRLICKGVTSRTESCTFGDGIFFWGWQARGATQPEIFAFEAPITIEITYSPVGRITSWDIRGDRATMQKNLTMAYANRVNKDAWQLDSPNFLRQIGQELEQRFLLVAISAFDVELPRKGDAGAGTWKVRSLPYFGKRGTTATGGARMTMTLADQKDEGAIITMGGDVTNVLVPNDTLLLPFAASEQTVYGDIRGGALIGAADGRILASEVWVKWRSTLPLFGFKVATFRATQWSDGMSAVPGPVPAIPE